VPTSTCVGDHQLANLAAYMVSDFSAYINGEVVVIDGGMVKGWSI
jgi:enoyl-[acyl-carrier-protein] reductase (NADH)